MQRVSEASVEVNGRVVGAIGPGLAVLVGYGEGDTSDEVASMADKIANLRVFEDEEGKMNLSVSDVGGGVLLVPNFTLYGDCRKGRRPSFTGACAPEPAEAMFEELAEQIAKMNLPVERGVFGARMSVALVNDGPVTLLLSSEGTF